MRSDQPLTLTHTTPVEESGDEARLLQRRLRQPIVVDKNRSRGVRTLFEDHKCDIALSDDGLQHYAMAEKLNWL